MTLTHSVSHLNTTKNLKSRSSSHKKIYFEPNQKKISNLKLVSFWISILLNFLSFFFFFPLLPKNFIEPYEFTKKTYWTFHPIRLFKLLPTYYHHHPRQLNYDRLFSSVSDALINLQKKPINCKQTQLWNMFIWNPIMKKTITTEKTEKNHLIALCISRNRFNGNRMKT